MSRVVRFRVTNFLSSGTQRRRVWMFTFCQRFVLMFEWETFCAFSLRLPVMSLLAMTKDPWKPWWKPRVGRRNLREYRAMSSAGTAERRDQVPAKSLGSLESGRFREGRLIHI